MRGVVLAGRDEAAFGVERFGAGVGGGDELSGLDRARELGSLLDKLAPDAAAPEIWLDIRPVDIRLAVVARHDNCEARRLAPVLEYDDEASGDVIGGQRQGFGMLELFRLCRVPFERGAALDLLQRLSLFSTRGAELAGDGLPHDLVEAEEETNFALGRGFRVRTVD